MKISDVNRFACRLHDVDFYSHRSRWLCFVCGKAHNAIVGEWSCFIRKYDWCVESHSSVFSVLSRGRVARCHVCREVLPVTITEYRQHGGGCFCLDFVWFAHLWGMSDEERERHLAIHALMCTG